MKKIFIMISILLCVLPCTMVSAAEDAGEQGVCFCTSDRELSADMERFFRGGETLYHRSSQGMCVAENYVIYTRYESDSSPTTYVVIDANTGQEVAHQDFMTRHSNSLTYNDDTSQVVSVSQKHAYVFSFRNGKMYLQKDYRLSHNCPKIAYNKNDGYYYLGTSRTIYRTKDFQKLTKVFHVKKMGIDQGMGCDGRNLYIIWYAVGRNTIAVYSTDGRYQGKYTLNSSIYREVEDVDFYGDQMMINIANSSTRNGVYQVASDHKYTSWSVTKQPTCADSGIKKRSCKRCGGVEYKLAVPTGKHQPGEWIVVKKPDCTSPGRKVRRCIVCDKVAEEEDISARGHSYSQWKVTVKATRYHEGEKVRKCTVCGHADRETIEKQKPDAKVNVSKVDVQIGSDADRLTVQLQDGDRILSWKSEDEKIATVTEDGVITGKWMGKTKIQINTALGAKAWVTVQVHLLPVF